MEKTLHIVANWNSDETYCIDTIHEHSKILDSNVDKFVWYGKMIRGEKIKENNLIPEIYLIQIQKQLKNNIPTYLFLYAPNDIKSKRIHVALIKEVTMEYPTDIHLIPPHYSRVPNICSYWFKVIDFKELSFSWVNELLVVEEDYPFDPVSFNQYPVIVYQRNKKNIFNYPEIGNRKFYAFQQLHHRISSVYRNPNSVFVIMPFKETFNDIYKLAISQATKELNLTCIRADDFLESSEIFKTVIENIHNSDIIIADITGNNPNVFYELGYAHAIGKKVIIITQDRKDTPFDIFGIRNIEYANNNLTDLVGRLKKTIEVNLKN